MAAAVLLSIFNTVVEVVIDFAVRSRCSICETLRIGRVWLATPTAVNKSQHAPVLEIHLSHMENKDWLMIHF
ncbi:hypothetical protein AMECASPLE_036203 [Ameca splendens]|uniref:Secreted protein n=1 Tax=Ameca splendens TaxID=208324 RepID=A0ABV0XWM8_9TELE